MMRKIFFYSVYQAHPQPEQVERVLNAKSGTYAIEFSDYTAYEDWLFAPDAIEEFKKICSTATGIPRHALVIVAFTPLN